MNYKLGKTPARPNAVGLKFGAFFNAEKLPTPPAKFGHYGMGLGLSWGMLANDQYSNCVFAGAAHETMVWTHRSGTGQPVAFNDATVLADYAAVTGFDPAKPDTDQGTDMVDAASYRRKVGIADASGVRHKIDSYVALRSGDADQLALATYLMGATAIGLRFPESAEKQFDKSEPWDYVIGSPLQGGHYVPCLKGDTQISLLDGKEVAIKDLVGTTQWIYAINKQGKVVPALATNIRRTRRGAKLIRIYLDNEKYFDCTPNHLIMQRDGSYTPAKQLTVNQSLMPLYKRKNSYDYEEVLHPAKETWQLTHRCVAQHHGQIRRKWVVHHIDFDKHNNRPNNLKVMSWDEHTLLHQNNNQLLEEYAKSSQGRERSRQLMLANWQDPAFQARHDRHLRTSSKLKEHRTNGFQNLEACSANGRKTGPINIMFAHTPKAEAKRTAIQIARLKNDPEFLKRSRATAIANLIKANASNRAKQIKMKLAQTDQINHKVVRIEYLQGSHDVYDMEVPEYHNFAIGAGVFVHNCVGRNSDGNFLIVTWGRLHAMTPTFLKNYCDEALAYVSIELLKNNLSPEGFNSDQLRRNLTAITT